jgi:hypothetical protein
VEVIGRLDRERIEADHRRRSFVAPEARVQRLRAAQQIH